MHATGQLTGPMTGASPWPRLVAAISAADPRKWTPRDLLHVAVEQVAAAIHTPYGDDDETRPIPPGTTPSGATTRAESTISCPT